MQRQRTFVDLFAGCGGFAKGLMQTGLLTPVAAVELDVATAMTYSLNVGTDVQTMDMREWVWGRVPHADVVVGGPPCQGFSMLGRREASDPRNELWDSYVEAVRRIKPAFFVLENVPQFLTSPQFAALQAETGVGGRLRGWELEAHLVNAASYGCAQNRRRALVFGRRSVLQEVGAPPTHARSYTLKDALAAVSADPADNKLPATTTVMSGKKFPGAFSMEDLHFSATPSAIALKRYQSIPPGGDRRDLPVDLMHQCWRQAGAGRHDVMGRLSYERPAVTIRTEFYKPEKGRYLHPTKDRPITHLEAALIQGFPMNYRWMGSAASIGRQIGNAVPPPLAHAVGTHLAHHLA